MYLIKGFLVIASLTIVRCVSASRDSGSLDQEGSSRPRRSTDNEQHAQLPPQSNAGWFMNQNLQSSYFVGQCVMCPPGEPGPIGVPGMQGMPGRDGRDQLIIGPVGEHVIQNSPTSTTNEGTTPSSAGVTFTRWGKTSCPSTSQLVYEGVMGSSNTYNQKGSGVNFLCMTLHPTFADQPSYGGGARIYGVEYENNLHASKAIHENEASCVVCLAPAKETVLTIPGTNTCLGSQDWTLEYQGYLMSSHYSEYKSEFICIDQDAEGIPRTSADNDEALLYVVDVACSSSGGGLPCPPYVTNYDVLCAVCTL